MDAEKLDTLKFFLAVWLQETISLCSSFLSITNNIGSLEHGFYKRSMFDQHYVLTATVMSRRFAGRVVHHSSIEIKRAINVFLENTELAEMVRDMREHSDAYFIGKGVQQDKFVRQHENGICDMSSSVRNENGYMLGSVISVEKIHDECKALFDFIKIKYDMGWLAPE